MDRNATIEAILNAAARPMPRIVESIEHEGNNGKWYGIYGFPMGVSHTGKTRSVGFVFQMPDGTTYGTRHATREAAEEKAKAYRDHERADFLAELVKMTDKRLRESAAYWLKQSA